MAKQHDEELQRLREDLEQTQQSSRKAHHAVSKLEEPMEAAGCSHMVCTIYCSDTFRL